MQHTTYKYIQQRKRLRKASDWIIDSVTDNTTNTSKDKTISGSSYIKY